VSQSTIRARMAQEWVRGQRRIRGELVVVGKANKPNAGARGRCRWTTVTGGEIVSSVA